MPTLYSGLPHINGNLMAAVDVETTGTRPRYHEIVQIGIVPLDSEFRPLTGVTPFYRNIKPLYPERADQRSTNVHGLDLDELVLHAPHPDKVATMLIEWFEKLALPIGKCLIPLAHNWAFESTFLTAWLGTALKEKLFHSHARDAMLTALHLNDKAFFRGHAVPFNQVGLGPMCKHFGIENPKEHDAFNDCIAEAKVYRCLIDMEAFP